MCAVGALALGVVLVFAPAGAGAANPVAMPWSSEGTVVPPIFPLVRPRVIENPPGPSTTGLRWRRWGSRAALGRGFSEGQRVRIRLSRVQWCAKLDRRAYTRARYVRAGRTLWTSDYRWLCANGEPWPAPAWARPK